MVFQKSLIRELTITAAAVFTVLLAILVTTQTINLLGRAAQGRIAFDAVFAMVGFWSLGFSPVLLILTAFISILTVMTRSWRDHEMAVWLSSGVPLRNWLGPVMGFTVPLAILIFVLAAFIDPWAALRSKEYSELLKQREELSAIAPGIFKESVSAERVYFIESFSPVDGSARNIFVQGTENEKVATVFAKTGSLRTNERGERVLTLYNGRRYAGEPGQANFETGEFEKLTVVVGITTKPVVVTDWQTRSTLDLLSGKEPREKAELGWRLSMPISALILAFLAIPLSYFNPRSGHTYNLLFALVVYLIYQNGLTYSRSLIAEGHVGLVGFIPIHVLMLLLGWFLLRYRSLPSGPFWRTAAQACRLGGQS